MNQPPPPKRHGPKLSSAAAQARLADALRENLRRRKAQIRARDAQEGAGNKPGGGSDGEGGKT